MKVCADPFASTAAADPLERVNIRPGLVAKMLLELVEGLLPTVVVKRTTLLGLERALGEGDVGRSVDPPESQLDDGLDIVWVRRFPCEGIREVRRRIDGTE